MPTAATFQTREQIRGTKRCTRSKLASAPEIPPPLGLLLLLSEDAGGMFRNQVRNLEERLISILQGVFERSRISLYREPFPTKAV